MYYVRMDRRKKLVGEVGYREFKVENKCLMKFGGKVIIFQKKFMEFMLFGYIIVFLSRYSGF